MASKNLFEFEDKNPDFIFSKFGDELIFCLNNFRKKASLGFDYFSYCEKEDFKEKMNIFSGNSSTLHSKFYLKKTLEEYISDLINVYSYNVRLAQGGEFNLDSDKFWQNTYHSLRKMGYNHQDLIF